MDVLSLVALLEHLSWLLDDPQGRGGEHGVDGVGIEPAGDLESLRCDHRHVGGRKLPANEEIVLKDVQGNALEIAAEIGRASCRERV